ncbi:MAG: hypothetical protein A2808_02675 [Candidatus Moranbacteria bacterium RIFCSPHIGHO2_01_FULL_55_24]|nr:MAG: hypothetical protein A2808_02675 [Candidatus Moranbacteria bacterium RIFCSPHIGHO2_01_FULL_55_24]
MSYRDRVLATIVLSVAAVALVFWFGALYVASTTEVPEHGGEYTEGIAAQPRYINPILSQTSDADADLVQLMYAGLFAVDQEGKVVKRLADNYEVSDEGRVYTITLKHGAKWHDGEEVTADDVHYTIQAIQDPAYKSPLRANWLAVETNVVDRYTIQFTLKKAYFGFLENLTVGILPKHIWENISPDKFLLADYNLAPIGSGPYRFYDSEKDSSGNILSLEMRAYKDYFEGEPYISKVVFHFYPDDESLLAAYNTKEILGIHSILPRHIASVEERKSSHIYKIDIPRIFSVFFNQTKSKALAYDEVREALTFATDRDRIVQDVLLGEGETAVSALMPFMNGYASDLQFPRFDVTRANSILDEKGWKKGTDGVRSKDGTPLEIEIVTPAWPELVQTANLLKSQWEAVGARINISEMSAADLQKNVIRPREYQALLFGQAAMLESDPYSFWHSSQKADPGLNLSLFDETGADDTLQGLREELDENKRRDAYRKFQEILIKENPAAFLYSPTYLYVVNDSVKGIGVTRIDSPSNRLSMMKDWYIKTDRVFKK